jgi:hypothetical protein
MNAPVTPWDNPAHKFAEQHQIDPDEGYRDAVFDEITDGLIWLGWGAGTALLLVVGVLYFGGVL